ncbi:MAG: HPP family protein, partial [Enterobacteriaceae bacterium]
MFRKFSGGEPLASKPGLEAIAKGFIGGSSGILVLSALTNWSGLPVIMAPLGATCVLLFAVPKAPLSQPRNVIGGHFISALIALLMINLVGNHSVFIALAVGLAIAAMQLFRVVHAPAGANPILIMMSGITDYHFLLTPVLLGSASLVVIALVVNNIGVGSRWPNYWL